MLKLFERNKILCHLYKETELSPNVNKAPLLGHTPSHDEHNKNLGENQAIQQEMGFLLSKVCLFHFSHAQLICAQSIEL